MISLLASAALLECRECVRLSAADQQTQEIILCSSLSLCLCHVMGFMMAFVHGHHSLLHIDHQPCIGCRAVLVLVGLHTAISAHVESIAIPISTE